MSSFLEFIIKHRWLFAIFLLPISFVYDVYWYLRSKWVLFMGSAPRKHQERLEFVQKQVLDWQKIGNGRKMCTARPGWMSITQQKITYKDTAYRVQVLFPSIFNTIYYRIFYSNSNFCEILFTMVLFFRFSINPFNVVKFLAFGLELF